jgi:hypothetical protein
MKDISTFYPVVQFVVSLSGGTPSSVVDCGTRRFGLRHTIFVDLVHDPGQSPTTGTRLNIYKSPNLSETVYQAPPVYLISYYFSSFTVSYLIFHFLA